MDFEYVDYRSLILTGLFNRIVYGDREETKEYEPQPFVRDRNFYNVTIQFYKLRVETEKAYLFQLKVNEPKAVWVPKKLAKINKQSITINKNCVTVTQYTGNLS